MLRSLMPIVADLPALWSLKRSKGITLADLSRKAGCSRRTVGRIFAGRPTTSRSLAAVIIALEALPDSPAARFMILQDAAVLADKEEPCHDPIQRAAASRASRA